ncbi:MAG: hypothetical protein Q4C96_08175 [Planctomycetia bacterium]|nr:hypothetical protein [Planctomycetia bacterium]
MKKFSSVRKYIILVGSTVFYSVLITAITYYFWGAEVAKGGVIGGGACLFGAFLAMRTVDLSKNFTKKMEKGQKLQIRAYSHLIGILLRAGVPLTVGIFALFFYKGGMDKDFTAGILMSYMVYYPFTLVVELMLTLSGKNTEDGILNE